MPVLFMPEMMHAWCNAPGHNAHFQWTRIPPSASGFTSLIHMYIHTYVLFILYYSHPLLWSLQSENEIFCFRFWSISILILSFVVLLLCVIQSCVMTKRSIGDRIWDWNSALMLMYYMLLANHAVHFSDLATSVRCVCFFLTRFRLAVLWHNFLPEALWCSS